MRSPILSKNFLQQLIQEDLPWGDITSESVIPHSAQASLSLIIREEGVLAGLEIAEQIFREFDPDLNWVSYKKEGEFLLKGSCLAKIEGRAQQLLGAERLALNLLQRLSGIATITHCYVREAEKGSDKVRVADTRKTTPGLRDLEKYAVFMGGGHNHRRTLSDAVMLKDNHLAVLKKSGISLKESLQQLRATIPHTMKIEVEIDDLSQLQEVLDAKVDIVLLDNMSCETLSEAVKQVNGLAIAEASGGVNLESIAAIAATGVDVISVGALTHSARALDIGLDYTVSK